MLLLIISQNYHNEYWYGKLKKSDTQNKISLGLAIANLIREYHLTKVIIEER